MISNSPDSYQCVSYSFSLPGEHFCRNRDFENFPSFQKGHQKTGAKSFTSTLFAATKVKLLDHLVEFKQNRSNNDSSPPTYCNLLIVKYTEYSVKDKCKYKLCYPCSSEYLWHNTVIFERADTHTMCKFHFSWYRAMLVAGIIKSKLRLVALRL